VKKHKRAPKAPAWTMTLWRVDTLLVWIQHEFDIGLDDALSLLVGHAKCCRMDLGADGWPYHGAVLANHRTQIKDLVTFAFPLGLRCEPLQWVRVKAAS
jgi:hypothetical protein